MPQTERLYWIDSEIRAGHFPNAGSLCEKFGVSRRTAYADRNTLVLNLGAPLIYNHSRRGWVYSNATFFLPFLALSTVEARALARSLLTAREYLGPADADAVDRLVVKLGEHLPAAVPTPSETVGGGQHNVPDVSVSQELLENCRSAIEDRKRIRILYHGAHRDQTTQRVVQPYHLHCDRSEWHLIGHCELRNGIRQFFLGRVQEWHEIPGEGSFSIPPTFDAQAYLAKGFGALHGDELVTVKLLFTARQARWIRERVYHPTQKNVLRDDGRLEVTLRVAGTQEILRWLLGYGAEVEVLEPAALRRDVLSAAQQLMEIYRDARAVNVR